MENLIRGFGIMARYFLTKVVLATAFLSYSAFCQAGEKELKQAWDAIPKTVREIAEKEHPGIAKNLEKIEELVGNDGKTLEFGFVFNVNWEIKITPEGKIVGREEGKTVEKIPEAIRKTLAAAFSDCKPVRYGTELQDVGLVHEVHVIRRGQEADLTFTEEGKLLETEWIIPVNTLPDFVRTLVTKKHPKAQIVLVEDVRYTYEKPGFYAIQAMVEGVDHRLEIAFNGEVLKDQIVREVNRHDERPGDGAPRAIKDVPTDPTDVPEAVRKSLETHYPGCQIAESSKEFHGETMFVWDLCVRLKGGRLIDVKLTPEGARVLQEKKLEDKELPEGIAKKIDELQPKWRDSIVELEEVLQFDENGKSKTYYLISLRSGKFVLDDNGNKVKGKE